MHFCEVAELREFAHIRARVWGDMPSVRALFDASRARGKPIQTVNLHLHAAVACITVQESSWY